MLPIEAWIKLTKKMTKDEYYSLKTFATLGRPSLLFQVRLDKNEQLEIMGVPTMGGVKLKEKLFIGKKEFVDLYPLYFSHALFNPKYAEVMQYAPYVFPLITEFIEGKEENYFEVEDMHEPENNEPEKNTEDNDAHLRAGNRMNKLKGGS